MATSTLERRLRNADVDGGATPHVRLDSYPTGDPETGARRERVMVTRNAILDPRDRPVTVSTAEMRNPRGAEEDL